MGSVLVCYSGGVDSALLLAVAHRVLGERAIGMTAVSPSLAEAERETAIAIAGQIGARHAIVYSHEIEREAYAANGTDRCFHCKSELYAIASKKREEWGLAWIANGTNLDDLGDYRPGLQAAETSGVRSPFVEVGWGKSRVRQAAERLGLSVWNKPAAACLASRLPYGTRVTRDRLRRIAALESDLRAMGLRQVRVRIHPLHPGEEEQADRAIARIEVGQAELEHAFALREGIAQAGKLHFAYVTLDLEGYRIGSPNEVIDRKKLPLV